MQVNHFHKLFVSLFATVVITLTAGHFCSAVSMADHHSEDQAQSEQVLHADIYKQCCTNKTGSQLTNPIQPVQKFNLDTQSSVTTFFYTLPISTTASSSLLQFASQNDKPDPGGGLVLRC